MSTQFILPTLAPSVTQTNAYLTELLARCAPLPLSDVEQLLNDAYADRWALGFKACAQFVVRLPHFVKMHLAHDVQAELNATGGLLNGFVRKMQRAKSLPENFLYWDVSERQQIEERQQQLIKSAEQARQNGRESDSERHSKDAAHIERVLIGLKAKEASNAPGNFCLSASELDTWCPLAVTNAAVVVGPQRLLDVSATGSDRWDGLLTNCTVGDLNNLLVFVGLLKTAEPLAVADDTKPCQWIAIAAALIKAKRTKADRAALHRAFEKTYGSAVGSLRGFQRGCNEANELAQKCFKRALSWLN